MRNDLLGLELSHALRLLEAEGKAPSVTQTCSPKAAGREGTLRVVFCSDAGDQLVVSRFVDPIADTLQEK